MSFADAAAKHLNRPGSKCPLGVALALMDQQLRAEVIEAFHVKTLSATAIAAELSNRGFEISHQTVQRHRAGRCRCPGDLR